MKQQGAKKINTVFKLTAAVLAVLLMVGLGLPAFALSPTDTGAAKEPIMVSLGDSYSSGEGIEPYYYAAEEDKFEQPDWLAHRSRMSWPGKLKLRDSDGKRVVMGQHKAVYSNKSKSYASFSKNNWYFVASSGAVTASLNGTQNKSYDQYPASESAALRGSVTLDNQLKVFESIAPGETDYVTMTMGGNDAHFADVFVYAAVNASFLNVNAMDDYLDGIWNEFYYGTNSIKNRLITAYRDIHRAAGNQAHIIIAGYPKILPRDGFLIFSKHEARAINSSITKLNAEFKSIVNSLYSEDFKIHFVSVEEAFEGHEIYTGSFCEYINGIRFARSEDLDHAQIISSSSIHPNIHGVQAYADCVQACIDEIEAKEAASHAAASAGAQEAEAPLLEEQIPLDEPIPAADYYCESSPLRAAQGEVISLPVSFIGNVPMDSGTLHVEYNGDVLQIDSVTAADLSQDGVETTLGAQANRFDVSWRSAGEPVESGTLFYLNVHILQTEQTSIYVTPDSDGQALLEHCGEIVLNPADERCTVTADLSKLSALQGAQVVARDNGALAGIGSAEAVSVQNRLEVSLPAEASGAQICFTKPGCTSLCVEIDTLSADCPPDLTDTLKQAAKAHSLLAKGDVNGDGCINVADISYLLLEERYGAPVSSTDTAADLNGDGVISRNDLAIVRSAYRYGVSDVSIKFTP